MQCGSTFDALEWSFTLFPRHCSTRGSARFECEGTGENRGWSEMVVDGHRHLLDLGAFITFPSGLPHLPWARSYHR